MQRVQQVENYAQLDTEAGLQGFDKDYFVQQVAGLAQLAGEFMLVKPMLIDLGWGTLKSAIVRLPDSSFVNAGGAKAQREALVNEYVGAFRQAEAGKSAEARSALRELALKADGSVAPGGRAGIRTAVDGISAKLA